MRRALDLFCGAGGATKGLQQAGYHVTGIDIEPQPHYCGDRFLQMNAFRARLDGYDLIWAGPLCKGNTRLKAIHKRAYPDQITPIRLWLQDWGGPYVIENVPGADLRDPVLLCGAMFGLGTLRHRLFESNRPLCVPPDPPHVGRVTRLGRCAQPGDRWLTVAGHFSDVKAGRRSMGIDWMTRDELSQAIPPAYSEFLARQFHV